MKKYSVVAIKENTLEELVRHYADKIETGLKYISHQRKTDRGRLDVIMVDSGGSLVIAELKIAEDDDMLEQGIDYYDYISGNIEGFSRAYKEFHIKPEQRPRLLFIAPSFSVTLLNRCKWIDIDISLYTFNCISLENDEDIIPVFTPVNIPKVLETIEEPKSIDKILEYITDINVRNTAKELLMEVQNWDKQNISVEPIKYDVSMKISGRVFAYLSPRRRFFGFYTYDPEDKWGWFPVIQADDLATSKTILRSNIDKLRTNR